MPEAGYTVKLANYASQLKFEDLPSEVIAMDKLMILNTIGCALRGHAFGLGKVILDVFKQLGGREEATIVGEGTKTSCANAASVNGAFAYSFNGDDSYYEGCFHPGHAVIPSAMAMAEREEATGKDLLTSVTAGFEVSCRVAASLCQNPDKHRILLGWKGNTLDIFGASVAAGKVLGMDPDKMAQAIGIACTTVAANYETAHTQAGQWDGGLSTLAGMIAALMAQQGMEAGYSGLEGPSGGGWKKGFCHTFGAGNEVLSVLSRNLGHEYETTKLQIKSRVASYWNHAAINAVCNIFKNHALTPSDVEKITVRSHKLFPGYDSRVDEHSLIVGHNVPYATAVAILEENDVTLLDDMVRHLHNPVARDLMGKFVLEAEPDFDKYFTSAMPATATVETKDGSVYEDTIMHGKGKFPESPMSQAEVEFKFKSYARSVLDEERVESIYNAVNNLEKIGNVRELTKLLQV